MVAKEEREFQLWLPGFEDLPQILVEPPPRQPRPDLTRKITDYRLLYEELDINFRAEVHRWLQGLKFPLSDVLREEEKEGDLLRLFLEPQEGRWLSETETALQIGWPPQAVGAVRVRSKYALLRVWRRERNGSRAIEGLKLPWIRYRPLLEAKIITLDGILALREEREIRRICGDESGLKTLKTALLEKGEVWEPYVVFPLFPYEA